MEVVKLKKRYRWQLRCCQLLLQAMGRIFVGLCQVGAWGCFDEFNRLEERMLSAVSQQIQTIQEALKELANPEKKEKSSRFFFSVFTNIKKSWVFHSHPQSASF